MKAIEVKNLSFKYRGTDEWALRDINLEIEEGEFVLIVGPTGCGKSTLCRCLNGLIPHFYEGEYVGDVYVYGIRVRETPTHVLARYVGMVFQEPEDQLIMTNVEREVAFGPENLGLPREEVIRRIYWALEVLGIKHLRERAPYELSGGEQQKVAIASILAMKPKILILDEPTSSLDPSSAKEVLDLLTELREELKVTIVLVEHRLELIASRVDRVIVMDHGRVVDDGDPREVLIKDHVVKLGVGVPKVLRAYKRLWPGKALGRPPLTPGEFVRQVVNMYEEMRDKS